MKRTPGLATLLVLFSVGRASAQGLIPEHGSVEREIPAGVSHAYYIQLNEGDYVAGTVEQRGITLVATVFEPDGERIRAFPGPRAGRLAFFVTVQGV